MKNLLITLVLILSAADAFALPGTVNTSQTDSLHLYLVVNCGRTDMASWNMIRARAIEAICALKAGDQITVVAAYPSGPRTDLDSTISQDKKAIDADIKRIATLEKDWLAKAGTSTAMALVYESLTQADAGRHCCIVLSTGDMGDEELARIKHLAELFTIRKSPITLICGHSRVNRKLLMGDIELHFLDKPAIGQWLSRVRPAITLKPETPVPSTTPVPNLAPAPKPYIVKPPVVPSPTKPLTQPVVPAVVQKPKPLPADSNSKVPLVIPKLLSVPSILPKQPGMMPAKTPGANTADPNKAIPGDMTSVVRPRDQKSFLARWIYLIIIAAVVLSVVCIRLFAGGGKTADNAADSELPKSLVAYIGEKRHELGSISDIREIAIGSGLGSTIFISGECIAPVHVRILGSGKGLKLQNCSDIAITVGAEPLKPKAKMSLDLPTDIELAQNISISLIEEEIAP